MHGMAAGGVRVYNKALFMDLMQASEPVKQNGKVEILLHLVPTSCPPTPPTPPTFLDSPRRRRSA